MNKDQIIKIYRSKIKEFNKHNKLYYDKSNPKISDSDYDDLKKEIYSLENRHDFLKNSKSPSNSVGFKPSKSFEKYKHKVPMLSLSNAFDKDDLINFQKKFLII